MATNHTNVSWVGILVVIYINIGPGMFFKLAVCVWEDPEPFP